MKRKHEPMVIGTVVEDNDVHLTDGARKQSNATTKYTCTIQRTLRGAPVNIVRAIRRYNGTGKPYFLLGDDSTGSQAMEELDDEFPGASFERCQSQTRRSIIFEDGRCFTTRPALNCAHLSDHLLTTVAAAELTVIGPMAAADADFVANALATAQQSILMLSLDQLRVRETALTLMRKASYIVFNDGEARELTGEANPDAALAACIAEGVGGGIIITSRAGAHARWPHRRLLAPALPVATVKQEIGAGDCLTGVFAAALCEGESVAQAMNLGQAAAAGHVAGLPPLAKAALAAWADKQAPVSPARRWHAAARLPRRPRFRAVKIDGKRGVRP